MAETFYMTTLGCDKNRVDAEMMVAKLLDAGYQLTDDLSQADFAIVNTCGFITPAVEEGIAEIWEVVPYRESDDFPLKHIIVTGCMAERFKSEIFSSFQNIIDTVIGLGANDDIVDIVQRTLNGEKIELFPPKENLPLNGNKYQTTPKHFAYLKIAEGCNNHCSYCMIPDIRGRYRSRKIEDIVEQATQMAFDGVKEIILVAQDTTSYGIDLYKKPMLVELLKELVKVEGISWIRMLYCYPQRITNELLELIAKEDKLVKYLDIPLQHCNSKVLREMNRGGDVEMLTKLIKHIRQKVPNITLRTTFIVGFPGETDTEFKELMQFAYDMKFERMGCFEYSLEEETPAGQRKDQVSNELKLARYRALTYQQLLMTDSMLEPLKGQTITVMHDGYDTVEECYCGHSQSSTPVSDPIVVYDKPDRAITPGTLIKVRVKDVRYSDLVGVVVDYGEDDS